MEGEKERRVNCNTTGQSRRALILPVSLVMYGVAFFATLYNSIDRLERGGEQHCIIFIDKVYHSV